LTTVAATAETSARDQRGAHVAISIFTSAAGGAIEADLGAGVGRANLKIGGQRLQLRLVRGAIYARGNGSACAEQLNVSTSKVHACEDRWLTIDHRDALFARLLPWLDLSTLVHSVSVIGPPQASAARSVRNVPVKAFYGRTESGATAAWYVAASGLPVEVFVSSGAGHETAVFSRWREPVTVAPPAPSTPYRSL
jgi:hypothetical protein